ncbi:helix-turn-helix domain-containing protein [Microbacterium sp. zg.B48]|uniref:helix-turn-helix domain-containing protein n=1 Tax=Microbacterium sp. zg.B48 TaxID=2969408 RepID=UPI00214BC6D9|nr:helix-turn-helix domain-containing protein [Microbacterium sp. zg.B48]MCR2764490.1 helix-turn-helix domain-containing protein [Microbacterium sp. zg.B48]
MRQSSQWILALTPAHGGWTPAQLAQRRAADAETIGSAVDAIGPGPVSWAVETAERITSRFRDDGEKLGVPTESTGFSRQGAEVGLLMALVAMAGESPLETIRISPAMPQLARIAVRQGMPVDALIHKAWASHAASQDEMLQMIGRLVEPQHQIAAIRAMSTAMFAHGNATVRALTDAYREERRQWDGKTRETRRRMIADLIRGGPAPADAEEILGLPLLGGHLFGLAFSATGRHVSQLEESVTSFARTAADLLGAARVIVVPHDAAVEMWWTFSSRQPPPESAALLRTAVRPPGVSISLGPAGIGIEGFRESYHGAYAAARVGRAAAADDVWGYDSVAHLSLLLQDRSAARRFVRHHLGPLLKPGGRTAEIRTTLRRYLETGNGRIAVAEELHIAASTVAYRVAQAEGMLGPGFRDRPVPILLALQLVELVPDIAS